MLRIGRLTHKDIGLNLYALAELRIKVFKEFPYIYDGSLEYEVKYLKKYLESDRAALIAAFDGSKIVGIASCLPLSDESEEVQYDFKKSGYDVSKIFYFGESVLSSEHRGKGIGKAFFKEREQWARSFLNQNHKPEYLYTAFCAVDRPENHPLRPNNYKPLNEFWKNQGYQIFPTLKARMSWIDIGDSKETEKELTFWLKEWKE